MKRLILCLCLVLVASAAWGTTYYKRNNGSAANKGAASGPCSDPTACMSPSVYAGESFSDGDVIVECGRDVGIPGKIWSQGMINVSRTIVVPTTPSGALVASGGAYVKTSGGEYVVTHP